MTLETQPRHRELTEGELTVQGNALGSKARRKLCSNREFVDEHQRIYTGLPFIFVFNGTCRVDFNSSGASYHAGYSNEPSGEHHVEITRNVYGETDQTQSLRVEMVHQVVRLVQFEEKIVRGGVVIHKEEETNNAEAIRRARQLVAAIPRNRRELTL